MPEEAIDWALGRVGTGSFTPELRAAQVDCDRARLERRPRPLGSSGRAGPVSSKRSAVVSASSPPAAIRPSPTRSPSPIAPLSGNRERVLLGDAPGLDVRGAGSRRARRPRRGARPLQRGTVVPARACRARGQLALLRGGRQRSRLEPPEADGGPAARSGIPPAFGSWREYAEFVAWGTRGGLFLDPAISGGTSGCGPTLGRSSSGSPTPRPPRSARARSPRCARPLSPCSRSGCGEESNCRFSRRTCSPRIVGARYETASRQSSRIPRRGFRKPPATDSPGCSGSSSPTPTGSARTASCPRLAAPRQNGADRQREVAAERGVQGLLEWLADGTEHTLQAPSRSSLRPASRSKRPCSTLNSRRPIPRSGDRPPIRRRRPTPLATPIAVSPAATDAVSVEVAARSVAICPPKSPGAIATRGRDQMTRARCGATGRTTASPSELVQCLVFTHRHRSPDVAPQTGAKCNQARATEW